MISVECEGESESCLIWNLGRWRLGSVALQRSMICAREAAGTVLLRRITVREVSDGRTAKVGEREERGL
jgi:hypothetical protein